MNINEQTVSRNLNSHPSIADIHNITGNSESPDRFSIDFNTLEPKSRHLATPYTQRT